VRARPRKLLLCAATGLWAAFACAAEAPLPATLAASLRATGVPLASFGLYARPVDGASPAALAALNTDRPFMLASTAKLVTTLSALDLLGPTHRWRTQAFATAPVVNGRLAGDLVIVGGDAGLTPADLRRWFKAMRAEGLKHVGGRIVLQRVELLHDEEPAQAATIAEESSPGTTPDARDYNRGALAVVVQPTGGNKAAVTLRPQPLGVGVINDVAMGGECAAWAQWRGDGSSGAPQLWVRGRWDTSCGKQDIAYMRPPLPLRLAPSLPAGAASAPAVSVPRLVATLWAESGGTLRRGVVETRRAALPRALRIEQRGDNGDGVEALPRWSSEVFTTLADLVREINKTSNNLAARELLESLGEADPLHRASALQHARQRVQQWLRGQGLAEREMHIDIGSGQSRAERGTPRALVQLLHNAWRGGASQPFVDSLPIAGVDGTLARRMKTGMATGRAYLKTGTLHDARALAGYVRAKSGKVYAVAALVNHAEAGRATPALDAFIEWVARNG